MALYLQKKMLFIHVWKTGGTSIARGLEDECQLVDSFSRSVRVQLRNRIRMLARKPPIGKHTLAVDYRNYLGSEYNELYKFAFVRNPWDWLASWYHFVQSSRSPEGLTGWTHHMKPVIGSMTFREYIDWVVDEDGLADTLVRRTSSFRDKLPVLQKDWIVDESGAQIVDFVGRFENLDHDFNIVLESVGLDPFEIPSENQGAKRDYRMEYDDESARKVEKYFQADLEMFGYSFDQ